MWTKNNIKTMVHISGITLFCSTYTHQLFFFSDVIIGIMDEVREAKSIKEHFSNVQETQKT